MDILWLRFRWCKIRRMSAPQRHSQLLPALSRLGLLPGYLVALWLARAIGGVVPWLLPSGYLLTTTAMWLWRTPLQVMELGGGPRARWMALLTGILATAVLVFSWWWPVHQEGSQLPQGIQLLQGLSLILLVPPAEELYFRGLLLDILTQLWGRAVAALVSSLLFGLMHWPQGLAIPMTVVALVLALAALASRSVLWAVAVHVCWNSLAVLRMATQELRGPLAVVACMGLLLLATVGLLTQERDLPQGQADEPAQDVPRRL